MHQFTGMHWCTQVYIFSYAHTCQLTQTVHSYTHTCKFICTQSHMTLKTCQLTLAYRHTQPPTPMHNSHSDTHANSDTHTNSHVFTHTAASQGHTPRPSTEAKEDGLGGGGELSLAELGAGISKQSWFRNAGNVDSRPFPAEVGEGRQGRPRVPGSRGVGLGGCRRLGKG